MLVGKQETMSLSQYVQLSCLSVDSVFRLQPVRAIIAPWLCTPLLLGGPFLSHNHIVIDHELRTCINKDTGYNLLNPPSPPKQTCQWDWKKEVIKELKYQLPMFKEECNAQCESVCGIDVITAIQCCIEQLVAVEDLQCRDAAMKKEFEDRFPTDIPHIEHLPDDVLFHVQPKDANKIIQRRSYDCPKKYCEAWKTLLQQHIDAGHLHPSNSSHSSPAFIIPRADPTVLPRWVNNF